MSYRIGVDIGGTFTDLVLVDDAGAVFEVSVPVPERGTAETVRTVSNDLIKARMNG